MNISVMKLESPSLKRDYKRYIEYRFFGMFPISLNAVPVSYEGSNLLKCSANFHFDRYVFWKYPFSE